MNDRTDLARLTARARRMDQLKPGRLSKKSDAPIGGDSETLGVLKNNKQLINNQFGLRLVHVGRSDGIKSVRDIQPRPTPVAPGQAPAIPKQQDPLSRGRIGDARVAKASDGAVPQELKIGAVPAARRLRVKAARRMVALDRLEHRRTDEGGGHEGGH